MKKYFRIALVFMVLMVALIVPAFAQEVVEPVGSMNLVDFLKENWIALIGGLIALAEVVVKLTPTEKDNSILKKIIDILFFFIPNLKSGGGTHKE